MSSDVSSVQAMLRALADALERVPEAKILSTLDGLGRAKTRSASSAAAGANTDGTKRRSEKLQAIIDLLRRSDTREEGLFKLNEANLSRRELYQLAELRSIHLAKSDTIGRIAEKIIEAIIGSRLNSLAIRGRDDSEP